MRIVETISDLKAAVRIQKKQGRTVGFVATMGYLHEGHMSLVKTSKQENDYTVLSIFVNPAQFGPNEDFDKYPRSYERDTQMAENAGADLVFIPSVKEMYPDGYSTYVNVEGITDTMCGKSRPGHFRGVTTVVCKLFNIVEPDNAYFGQKDAQQVAVLKRMVRDLNMNLKIITCPIVREPDGLAMSSRNIFLNPEERKSALILSKTLFEVESAVRNGERNGERLLELMSNRISADKALSMDYAEVKDAETLESVKVLKGKILVALAVRVGETRLIDNIVLEV